MPATSGIAFLVDENLTRLGRGLGKLRSDLAVFGDPRIGDEVWPGMLDSEWIPVVGARRWILITNDQRIRTRPAEASSALEHGLMVIHLHGKPGSQTAWKQAERLFSRWYAVEKLIDQHREGPWWLSMRRNSAVELSFDPGHPERI